MAMKDLLLMIMSLSLIGHGFATAHSSVRDSLDQELLLFDIK